MILRRGLRESLERYARRAGLTPDEARQDWRMLGVFALFPRGVILPLEVFDGYARTSPGLSVPTRKVTDYELEAAF